MKVIQQVAIYLAGGFCTLRYQLRCELYKSEVILISGKRLVVKAKNKMQNADHRAKPLNNF